MRGLPIFIAISVLAHAGVLLVAPADRASSAIQATSLMASIRMPQQKLKPVISKAPARSETQPKMLATPAKSTITVPVAEPSTTDDIAKGSVESELSAAEAFAISFWSDDVEDRIRKAGERNFTRSPGAARVLMLIAADGQLLDLQVTGEAAEMAEKAIRSVAKWPRFQDKEPRLFKRRLQFVIA